MCTQMLLMNTIVNLACFQSAYLTKDLQFKKKRFNDKDLFYFSLEAFVRKYEFRVTY